MNKKTLFITQAAVIAAIYTVLVLVFNFASFGPIQSRVAEALTILPYFTPAAIPGVAIGCFISAILGGASVPDMVFGTLATLVAALISYRLRSNKYLVAIPPIVLNALVVPWVLKYSYGAPDAVPFMMLTVGVGELISAGILGMILLFALEKVKNILFPNRLIIK